MGKNIRNLILFLLIAFLIPLLMVLLQEQISDEMVGFILLGIRAAAPTLAAVVVLLISRELRAAFSRMFRKEHLGRALLIPVFLVVMTMLPVKLICSSMAGGSLSLGQISVTQFTIILWALVAEEIGWRGYLEPLLDRMGVHRFVAPGIVGVIWALWHYHYFWKGQIDVPILLFLIGCIVESYLYSFLMRSTEGNVVSAMLYHFLWNLGIHVMALNPADNNGNTLPYTLLIGLEAIAVVCLCLSYRLVSAGQEEKEN